METITNIILKLPMVASHAFSAALTFATVTESIPSLKVISL